MPYLFATEDRDYADYASGRVIYNQPGLPAFPVRLASEMFLRAVERINASPSFQAGQRLTLYDPTCGGAYHLAALGLLHGAAIGAILVSDVDERALELARRNLGLLSPQGLDQREQEIREMLQKYGKESHADALKSVAVLRGQIEAIHPIRTSVFQANAMDPAALRDALRGEHIDLVISDIPYGQLSAWRMAEGGPGEPPVWRMLEALLPNLPTHAIAAIAADKAQKITHAGYRRIERFQIGKRQVSLLAPAAPLA